MYLMLINAPLTCSGHHQSLNRHHDESYMEGLSNNRGQIDISSTTNIFIIICDVVNKYYIVSFVWHFAKNHDQDSRTSSDRSIPAIIGDNAGGFHSCRYSFVPFTHFQRYSVISVALVLVA